MPTLFLGLAMLAGVTDAGERDVVTKMVIAKAVPYQEWCRQVEEEARLHGKSAKAVRYFSGDYYDGVLTSDLRWQLHQSKYFWTFDEQFWYVTGHGKAPDPSRPLTLAWRVKALGQRMTREMKSWTEE